MASKGINKVILLGRLGRDPEVSYTAGNVPVCKFSMATSETWTDKGTGEKKEKTEWSNIVAFGKLAEICGNYLTKGMMVYVEGRLQTRSWEKDGITRYATEINISDMQMLGSKSEGNKQDQAQGYTPPVANDMAQNPPAFDDDSIPF